MPRLPIAKEAKDIWRAAPCAGPLTVTARGLRVRPLRARRLSRRQRGAISTAPRCSSAPRAAPTRRARWRSSQPESRARRDWQVATTLPSAAARRTFGFGTYRAANYDELIDHPVEMASFARGYVRRRWRAARHRRHGPHPCGPGSRRRAIWRDLPVADRSLRRRVAWPRAVRSLPVPGHRSRRRLRRPRASLEHEPSVPTRRACPPGRRRASATTIAISWGSRATNTSTAGT